MDEILHPYRVHLTPTAAAFPATKQLTSAVVIDSWCGVVDGSHCGVGGAGGDALALRPARRGMVVIRRSPDETPRLGDAIYERDTRSHVEATHHSKMVSIGVGSVDQLLATA